MGGIFRKKREGLQEEAITVLQQLGISEEEAHELIQSFNITRLYTQSRSARDCDL
jgi:hypothetical protein